MLEKIVGSIPGVAGFKRVLAERAHERVNQDRIKGALDDLSFGLPANAREIIVLELDDSQFELSWVATDAEGKRIRTQQFISTEVGPEVMGLVEAGVPIRRIPGRLIL